MGRRPDERKPAKKLRSARYERYEDRLALSAQGIATILSDASMQAPPLQQFTAERPAADFYLNSELDQRIESHLERLEQHVQDLEELDRPGLWNLTASAARSGGLSTQLASVHDATGVNYVHNTYGFDGSGQTVAIIDSGIAWDHVALGGGYGEGYRVVGGYDFAENDADPYDDGPAGFHGTHVAGIVGSDHATYRGTASGVDLVGLRVFDDNGAGYFDWVEQALQWVHDHQDSFENPITTVNMSLGTSWNSDSIPNWTTIEDELAQLEQDGIFVVVSAGNAFQSYLEPGLSYPAASPFVVPVSSVDADGSFSSFSQRHDRAIAAPGRSITSTVPDHVFGGDGNPNDFGAASGTSMASPYLAGASTLVRQAMEFVGVSNITQDTIYDHLRQTADIFYDSATKANYHRLNVQSALDALMPADDYGSTTDAAHDLGELTDPMSIQGTIGELQDVDYFTFTAESAGELTITSSGSSVRWELTGTDVASTGAATLQLEQGREYTLRVEAGDGLANYSLNLTPTYEFMAIEATALLDATTWDSSSELTFEGSRGVFFGDDLIAIDDTRTYQLSGTARSGDGSGGSYHENNRQYLGFASYDADENLILPYHVMKVSSAADTRLAQTVRQGDTQIVLQDATGWNNAGAAHQRSFAWYGYEDGTGHVHEDYTYTRNVKFQNAWRPGAINYETNTITLAQPWDGPEITAGTAVRNAQSGPTFNYAAMTGSVGADWTTYEATIGGDNTSASRAFRPGTSYIRSLVLANYHGEAGNKVTWKDVQIGTPDGRFAAGTTIDLVVKADQNLDSQFQWSVLNGPETSLEGANSHLATARIPAAANDYELSFAITVSSTQGTANETISVVVESSNFVSDEVDATHEATWSGNSVLSSSDSYQVFIGDDMVAIDADRSYELSGMARSGGEDGSSYDPGNRQYFGFASYDSDQNLIMPYHVQKFEGAVDTRLAQPLRPGDTEIHLVDATGWNDAGAGHQRSLAWYGYQDGSGDVYEDFTYTRNVLFDNAWNPGAVDYARNTITLNNAWEGPELEAGRAVRNAQSGATFNYAAMRGAVPDEWTQYNATIESVHERYSTTFRPGTAFIAPLVLANYKNGVSNLVEWKDVTIRPVGSNSPASPLYGPQQPGTNSMSLASVVGGDLFNRPTTDADRGGLEHDANLSLSSNQPLGISDVAHQVRADLIGSMADDWDHAVSSLPADLEEESAIDRLFASYAD